MSRTLRSSSERTLIRDSVFEPRSPMGWSWLVTATGAPADDVVIEYNRFVRTQIRGNGYTATHNAFEEGANGTALW